MANPLYEELNQAQPTGNMSNLIQEFQKFKHGFNGDPKTIVQNLLNTGKMSQAQFNQLSQMANQLAPLIPNL